MLSLAILFTAASIELLTLRNEFKINFRLLAPSFV